MFNVCNVYNAQCAMIQESEKGVDMNLAVSRLVNNDRPGRKVGFWKTFFEIVQTDEDTLAEVEIK